MWGEKYEKRFEGFDSAFRKEYPVKTYRIKKSGENLEEILEKFIKPIILYTLERFKDKKGSWVSVNGTRIKEYSKEQLKEMYKESEIIILEYLIHLGVGVNLFITKTFNKSTIFIEDEFLDNLEINYQTYFNFSKKSDYDFFEKVYEPEINSYYKKPSKMYFKKISFENLDTIFENRELEIFVEDWRYPLEVEREIEVKINDKLVYYHNKEAKIKYKDNILNFIKEKLKENNKVDITVKTKKINKKMSFKIGDYLLFFDRIICRFIPSEVFEDLFEMNN